MLTTRLFKNTCTRVKSAGNQHCVPSDCPEPTTHSNTAVEQILDISRYRYMSPRLLIQPSQTSSKEGIAIVSQVKGQLEPENT